jgi:hypothetical protein
MFKIIAASALISGLSAIVALPNGPSSTHAIFNADKQRRTEPVTRSYLLTEPRGVPVFFCIEAGNLCGKPAADAFCRSHGFSEALTFQRNSLQRDLASLYFHQIKCWQSEADRVKNE